MRDRWPISAESFGADLTEREVRLPHGATNGPQTADDVLWRRSKLGLRLSAAEKSPRSTPA